MDALYLLIPMSVLAMLAVLGVFAWALHGGQFDDLEAEGARVLAADGGGLDIDQAAGPHEPEQCPGPDATRSRRSA